MQALRQLVYIYIYIWMCCYTIKNLFSLSYICVLYVHIYMYIYLNSSTSWHMHPACKYIYVYICLVEEHIIIYVNVLVMNFWVHTISYAWSYNGQADCSDIFLSCWLLWQFLETHFEQALHVESFSNHIYYASGLDYISWPILFSVGALFGHA